jgi:hypothetical protein
MLRVGIIYYYYIDTRWPMASGTIKLKAKANVPLMRPFLF